MYCTDINNSYVHDACERLRGGCHGDLSFQEAALSTFSQNYVSENCPGSLMKAVSQCAATKKAHPGVVALREPNLFIHMTLEASFAGAFVGASANTFFLSRSLKIHG